MENEEFINMDNIDPKLLDRPIEEWKPFIRDAMNSTQRHVVKLEEALKEFDCNGSERCRDHNRRVIALEGTLMNGQVKKLFNMNLYQWIVLAMVLCGIVGTYTSNVNNLDYVTKQIIKIEQKLDVIYTKLEQTNERMARLEAKQP